VKGEGGIDYVLRRGGVISQGMVEDISILGGKDFPLKYPKGMVEDIL